MTSSFCPGHVSCVFRPVRTGDVRSTGSLGIGLRLSLGSRAEASERPDGEVRIVLDGSVSEARVTREAVRLMAPGRGFDIAIGNDLPVSQGFGTSASGTLAACECIRGIVGEACAMGPFEAAHEAEVVCGGGLGDVSAISGGFRVPVRTVAGLPPAGKVEDSGVDPGDFTLVVLGGRMETGPVLSDPLRMEAVMRSGDAAMGLFAGDMTREGLYKASRAFSSGAGLECGAVSEALRRLDSEGWRSGMCMLGNSIFTDAPPDAAEDILRADPGSVFRCGTSVDGPVIRKA